jgi:hypothetical protein
MAGGGTFAHCAKAGDEISVTNASGNSLLTFLSASAISRMIESGYRDYARSQCLRSDVNAASIASKE